MSDIIKVDFNDISGSFFIKNEGKKIAEMTFSFQGKEKISIDHTIVKPAFEGKGIGNKLVEKAVAFAREKKLTIIPNCTFAKQVLEKNKNYDDVL